MLAGVPFEVETFDKMSSGFGDLVPFEFSKLPFVPQRVFVVSGVAVGERRGVHAHRACHQLLIAVSGEIKVELTDGTGTHNVTLKEPNRALHIPPMVWASQTYQVSGSVLLVFASLPYSRADYIEDFDTFIREVPRG